MQLPAYLEERVAAVEAALDQLLPSENEIPQSIHRAMRYTVLGGGKRVRPLLCLEAGRAVGGEVNALMPIACAIEMIHTYSLIHDDLPALDNDDLRRGRPTCHRVFGEAIAILTGDALLTRAFEILAHVPGGDPARPLRVLQEISRAIGTVEGMIGGQVVDLESEGKEIEPEILNYIHSSKTAALLQASVRAGAIFAGAGDAPLATLSEYGQKIGLAFQVADDILDVTSSADVLGKTPGKDQSTRKATFPALYGLSRAQEMARQLARESLRSLVPFDARADGLRFLAQYIVERAT